MSIKNIIFDIGNVLLKWSPIEIVIKTFPEHHNHQQLTIQLAKSQIWFDLNLGKITEKQAISLYHQVLGIDVIKLEELMFNVKESLIPIEGSLKLLNKLYKIDISLYTITDNVKEIVSYIKQKYDFWHKFKGSAVSAEIGFLKPAPEIYLHLLDTYNLIPQECVFIDDIKCNVRGAQNANMFSFQFTNSKACTDRLKKLGVNV